MASKDVGKEKTCTVIGTLTSSLNTKERILLGSKGRATISVEQIIPEAPLGIPFNCQLKRMNLHSAT